MLFMGIDPGANGGIAVVGDCGCLKAFSMPETDKDILTCFRNIQSYSSECIACLEKVNAMSPGRQACFQLGGSYRALRMALHACGIPFAESRPEEWQRSVGCPPPKRGSRITYAQRKAKLRERAQAYFPEIEVTDKTADALLIAEYCRRTYGKDGKP